MKKKLNLVFDTLDNGVPNCGGVDHEYFRYPYFIKMENYLCNFCTLDDINEQENFYYIIDYSCGISYFLHEPYDFLKPEVENACRTKNLKILFVVEEEADQDDIGVLEKLMKMINKKNLKEENFYYLNNNSRLEEFKNKLNTKINVYTIKILAERIIRQMIGNNIVYKKDKKFLFLCHNRVAKEHRILILSYLCRSNIINDVDWSLIAVNYNFGTSLSNYRGLGKYIKIEDVEKFNNIKSKASYFEKVENVDIGGFFCIKSYSNSYINIITESNFKHTNTNIKSNVIHISEKSYRSFYFLQLPLFVAGYEHIKYMRLLYPELDFFDDLIDHSYDLERDDNKRMIMIFNEIKRLHDNKNVVIQFYKNNEIRLHKNQEFLKSLIVNTDTLKYFRSLI